MARAEPDRRETLEFWAVLATAAGHLLFQQYLGWQTPFLATALFGWVGYAAWRLRADPSLAQAWGLHWHGAIWAVLILGAGAELVLLAGTPRWSAHLGYCLLLYPLWGLVQQFLLLSIAARQLRRRLASDVLAVVLVAVLFGLLHWPDPMLMGGTAVLGLVFTPLFFAGTGILPLGVVHGWLGALTYYLVLGRDPWAEIFG